MIKAVLFDLDDTLLNSIRFRIKAFGEVLKKAGLEWIDPEQFLFNLHGSSFEKSLTQLAKTHNIPTNLFASYLRAYWFNIKGSDALYPGVKEMLDIIKAQYKLGIVTSKFRDNEFEGGRTGCMIELERTGIDKLFSVIIGLEDVQKTKPDPECIHLALNRIAVAPGDTLIVGDSAADIAAAKAAGCKSCRAVWGIIGGYRSSEEIEADFTAGKPDDVIRFLKNLG